MSHTPKLCAYEKQEFIKSFVEKIEIYPEELEDGRILKNIKFRFPVFFNGSEVSEISWDKESTVEAVIMMTYCGLDKKSRG
ncbi:hypothetical protein [Lacrimispora xylanolytica]|uniref:Uncharacterized protein n=1 Tax=Lacrimispora xylanolytica TaxID=29375 RepID=A0ABY7AI18_9FIRM|nr:hypothetical protein [Lacrimispora xylanolytica]WAJ25182.1 hypothetical protein OW255_06645 [Lacrimispora xylanolytica]